MALESNAKMPHQNISGANRLYKYVLVDKISPGTSELTSIKTTANYFVWMRFYWLWFVTFFFSSYRDHIDIKFPGQCQWVLDCCLWQMSKTFKSLHHFLKEEPVSRNFIYDNHYSVAFAQFVVFTPVTRYTGSNNAGEVLELEEECKELEEEERERKTRKNTCLWWDLCVRLWLIIALLWNMKCIYERKSVQE